MKTKYIGVEGFNEIENLSTRKQKSCNKKSKKLSTTKKTVRFIKRASVLGIKSFKKLSGKTYVLVSKNFNKVLTFGKSTVKKVKTNKSNSFDRFYSNRTTINNSEFNSSVKDAITSITAKNERKYAHSAPNTSNRFLKRKAVLASVAAMSAIMLSCMTVAGAVDANKDEVVKTSPIALEDYDKNVSAFSSDAYSELSKSLMEENIQIPCVGLYIDGELIGATTEIDALNNALSKLLADYRADYDEATTTEFANDVFTINAKYDDNVIMTAEEIMKKAEGKFSISLSTDIVYDIKLECDTTVEYDDTQDTNYEKVKVEGVDGEKRVTMRTTFTDGVQTDAYVTSSEVTKEPKDGVVVRGTQESGTGTGSFIWPVPYTHAISSYYEYRWGSFHGAIDVADSGIYGQAIVASDSGTVIQACDAGDGYGYCVIIDHGNGYTTLYAHCSSLAVSYGETVSKGDTIGYIGSTGYSTGPHLHFEIREGSTKLNPLDFVS